MERIIRIIMSEEISMILTVTMNPSIDTSYPLKTLVIDDVNRVVAHKTAGGKGLNVSRVLCELGADVCATGLSGGHMGAYLCELMEQDGIPHDFVPIKGETRVCISALHEGKQTEFLEAGPKVTAEELSLFTKRFEEKLSSASCVTISGSLPLGVDTSCYADLIKRAHASGVPVLLDTSGEALHKALEAQCKPTLIKPNLSEINQLLNTTFTSDDTHMIAERIIRDPRFFGIAWVVVSMGKDGLFAVHEGQTFRLYPAHIEAVNATGSGDATIAGFAYGMAHKLSCEELLKYGATCGTLNALEAQTGHINTSLWDTLYRQCRVECSDIH